MSASQPSKESVPATAQSRAESILTLSNQHRLLAYVASLELEVDRLRRQNRFIQGETDDMIRRVQRVFAQERQTSDRQAMEAEVSTALVRLDELLQEAMEHPDPDAAHDQVASIAVRPLAERIFRWQQRLLDAPNVSLHLELEAESVNWFPARLHHILENLIANALQYRDPAKSEAWLRLHLRISPEGYEFTIADNGIGMWPSDREQVFDLAYRARSAREFGPGVGLAVVKLLVEQSCGTLTVDSQPGRGTNLVVVLPVYAVDDFLL